MQLPGSHWIRLIQNRKLAHIYDVELSHIERLKDYGSVECHIVLYPYSRRIRSSHLTFNPYEEYAKDISERRKSLYTPIVSPASSLFGISLGLLIIFLFWSVRPEEVFSLQSIISILGAYFIGKDLWTDIEQLLVNVTKTWRLRYQRSYYGYQLERNTTLTNYSALAREHRYGTASLLPDQLDFIQNSNSLTVRMRFAQADLRSFKEAAAHILSIRVEPELREEFERSGFMFGVKLTLNRRVGLMTRGLELFQSLSHQARGCLDEHGRWIEDGVTWREVLAAGRLRFSLKRGILENASVIDASEAQLAPQVARAREYVIDDQ